MKIFLVLIITLWLYSAWLPAILVHWKSNLDSTISNTISFLAHIIISGVFGLYIGLTLRDLKKVTLLILLYSVLGESLQILSKTRIFSITDLITNFLACSSVAYLTQAILYKNNLGWLMNFYDKKMRKISRI